MAHVNDPQPGQLQKAGRLLALTGGSFGLDDALVIHANALRGDRQSAEAWSLMREVDPGTVSLVGKLSEPDIVKSMRRPGRPNVRKRDTFKKELKRQLSHPDPAVRERARAALERRRSERQERAAITKSVGAGPGGAAPDPEYLSFLRSVASSGGSPATRRQAEQQLLLLGDDD